ncbi:hypothetical protein BST47_04215 [Mycolicibacterium tusciae]|uniref:HNH nuclease domain-containing protein n=1 Tax=Mycolicibacterium tusciae TaxID=75922 RepID=A0A1X0JYK7_9MYCO|nr:hypothetical protein BST47_04215 [Mycolicibacterium tusciae]
MGKCSSCVKNRTAEPRPDHNWLTSDRRTGLPADWDSRRRKALSRDGYRCQLRWRGCTEKATDVDHRRRGNDHALSNLQSVCSTCHKQKTAKESAARKAALKARARRPAERHPGELHA